MSDARLRTLERAAATGDHAAQVAFLQERLRLGTLTQQNLELAAYAGDPAAREARGLDEFEMRGGLLCPCGALDVEHDLDTGHGAVHACEYYGVACDCVREDRTELRPHVWPDQADPVRWVTLLSAWPYARVVAGLAVVERVEERVEDKSALAHAVFLYPADIALARCSSCGHELTFSRRQAGSAQCGPCARREAYEVTRDYVQRQSPLSFVVMSEAYLKAGFRLGNQWRGEWYVLPLLLCNDTRFTWDGALRVAVEQLGAEAVLATMRKALVEWALR